MIKKIHFKIKVLNLLDLKILIASYEKKTFKTTVLKLLNLKILIAS